MGSAELAIHVVCVCVCSLLHAFQGALWHNKGGACHSPPTKESLHSACSWTSLHWSTNFVSQLTFGEKVGPLVRASGPLASCGGVCRTRGTPVTPIDQPSSRTSSLFPPPAGVRLRRSHNLGIGSETLGSCCSSQTRGSHTCHCRFSVQLLPTQPQPCLLSHRDKIIDATRSGSSDVVGGVVRVGWVGARQRCSAPNLPVSGSPASPALLDQHDLVITAAQDRPRPPHDLAEHQLRPHPGPVVRSFPGRAA